MLQGTDVSVGEVGDVDVISQAGAIRRRVIVAEDLKLGAICCRRSKSEWDQVRFGVVEFADLSAVVGSGGIEVAQAGRPQAVSSVVGFERVFKKQFGGTVGVNWLARRLLRDGNTLGSSVDGARGRKDKMAHTRISGGIEQGEGIGDIVPEIFARVGNGFSDVGVSGEVHDRVDAREDSVEFGLIADIALDELKALREAKEAGRKIVVNDDAVACPPQSASGMTSDITCASYYENGQWNTSLN